MTKCLVTKLNGTVSNEKLLKPGEMSIGIPAISDSVNNAVIYLLFNKETTLKIIGNGHFTDSTFTQDYGKEIMSNDSRIKNSHYYVSNTGYVQFVICDKYSLVYFDFSKYNFGLSLDDLKYSHKLTYIVLDNTKATGDVSSLSDLTALNGLTAMNTGVTGDLSSLSNLNELAVINTVNTSVTADISFYANKPKMSYITSGKTTGDVSNLKNCPNLVFFSCSTNSVLSGDISQLPAQCKHFNMKGKGVSGLTWSNRPSSSSIVGMSIPNWAPANIDKVLQDLSACQAIHTSSDPAYYKAIYLGGKRTAASDDAVATLQSKGFSVEVSK